MKVYLVEMDNGEFYDDFFRWTEKVFTNHLGASLYLIDSGYAPHPEIDYKSNEYYLMFTKKDEEGRKFDAVITEKVVEDFSQK